MNMMVRTGHCGLCHGSQPLNHAVSMQDVPGLPANLMQSQCRHSALRNAAGTSDSIPPLQSTLDISHPGGMLLRMARELLASTPGQGPQQLKLSTKQQLRGRLGTSASSDWSGPHLLTRFESTVKSTSKARAQVLQNLRVHLDWVMSSRGGGWAPGMQGPGAGVAGRERPGGCCCSSHTRNRTGMSRWHLTGPGPRPCRCWVCLLAPHSAAPAISQWLARARPSDHGRMPQSLLLRTCS